MPIFPILCLLAALFALRLGGGSSRAQAPPRRAARSRCVASVAAVLLAQGLVYSDPLRACVLSRADTRSARAGLAASRTCPPARRSWSSRSSPERVGHATSDITLPTADRLPLARVPRPARIERAGELTSAPGHGRLENYERTLAPALIGYYERTATAGWSAARASPAARSPIRRRCRWRSPTTARSPARAGRLPRLPVCRTRQRPVAFNFDWSLRLLPARLRPPGPGGDHLPAARRRCATAETSMRRGLSLAVHVMTLTRTETDSAHLSARSSWRATGAGAVKPNPVVGAVIARDGEVLGEGWHERFGAAARRGQRDRGLRRGRPERARRCTCRSSPAATRARRRRAPMRSCRRASGASSSAPTTRPRRPPAAASAILRDEGVEVVIADGELGHARRGCSTRPSASTRASGARGCCSSPR